METAALSLLVLVAIFVLGTVLPINIGILAFVGAFVVGFGLAGLAPDEILSLFPTNIFVLLAGVTYMFSVASRNGTMQILSDWAVRLVRGRVAFIPWVFHILAIFFSGIGAGPAASTAVLAPLALGVAAELRINPFLVGIMLVHGSHGGSMLPISPLGAIVNGSAAGAGLPDSSIPVFVNSIIFNVLIAIAAYLLFGGIGLIRRGTEIVDTAEVSRVLPAAAGVRTTGAPGAGGGIQTAVQVTAATETTPATGQRLSRTHVLTLVGILALLILGIGFRLDIGFTALTIGLLLSLLSPREDAKAVGGMAWSTILMLGGILTYIGVVTEVGGLKLISDFLLGLGTPVVGVLLLALVAAITSLFSATGAVTGAMVPILAPILHAAGGAVPVSGAVSTLAISSSVVDSSPFSLQGAVILANMSEEQRPSLFRKLLVWGCAMVIVGSLIPWLIFVAIPSLAG